MDGRFVDRVVLVTGAVSGIGQAVAIRLACEGAVVAVNHRPGSDPQKTLRLIDQAGGRGFPVAADMRDPRQIAAMVEQTAQIGGRLDGLVSNAAINPFMTWDQTSVDDFDALSETNFRGTWVVCTESAKQMIKEGHGGAICCVSSISAHVSAPGQVAYCGTKGAISMVVKSLGAVLGEHQIRVNAVEPGVIDTRMAAPLFEDAGGLQYYNDRIALHRIGRPDEVAAAVAFLLSDDASYVTSATLLVDAGFIVNAEL